MNLHSLFECYYFIFRNSRISVPLDSSFDAKQLEHNRPFFFEYLEVNVFDVAKSVSERIGECRVPLIDIGRSRWYKVVKPLHNSGYLDVESTARLQISIDVEGELNSFFYSNNPRQLTLAEVFPPTLPQHSHLFMQINPAWSPDLLLGNFVLPGPIAGEVIEDLHMSAEVCFLSCIIVLLFFYFMCVLCT